MANPASLTALFGINAIQNATTITITKADFVAQGLTVSANNTAESLLAALILKANVGQDTSTDAYMQVTPQDQYLLTRNGNSYRRFRYAVDFFVAESAQTLHPDNVL